MSSCPGPSVASGWLGSAAASEDGPFCLCLIGTRGSYWSLHMSNEKFNYENGKFERRDLSAGGVLGFLGGLGIVGVLIYLVLGGMYGFLNRYEKAHEPPQNPLIGATNADTRH